MALELHDMLVGNVNCMSGENVKPSYGDEEEAFLRKVVTPIYSVIAKVLNGILKVKLMHFLFWHFPTLLWTLGLQSCCHRKLKTARMEHQSILNGETTTI